MENTMSKVKTYLPANMTEVQAIQYVKGCHNDVAVWCGGEAQPPADDPKVIVPHIYGSSVARIGDWVVRSPIDGRFFVLSDEQFTKAYRAKPLFELNKDRVTLTGISVNNAKI